MPKIRRTHVIPTADGWTLKKEGRVAAHSFKTKREALDAAKRGLRKTGGGDVVIHSRDGRIRDIDAVGKSKVGRDIKDPPPGGRLSKSQVRDAVLNASRALGSS